MRRAARISLHRLPPPRGRAAGRALGGGRPPPAGAALLTPWLSGVSRRASTRLAGGACAYAGGARLGAAPAARALHRPSSAVARAAAGRGAARPAARLAARAQSGGTSAGGSAGGGGASEARAASAAARSAERESDGSGKALATRPPPPPPAKWSVAWMWKAAKETASHYYHGSKLLYADAKIAFRIFRRLVSG